MSEHRPTPSRLPRLVHAGGVGRSVVRVCVWCGSTVERLTDGEYRHKLGVPVGAERLPWSNPGGE